MTAVCLCRPRRLGRLAPMLAMSLLALAALPAAATGTGDRCAPVSDLHGQHWVSGWYTAPTDAEIVAPMANNTVRQFIAPHARGDVVRLKLTNRYSSTPVTLAEVWLAQRAGDEIGAELAPGSGCRLSFGGDAAVTMAAGASILSDPIHFPVAPFDKVAVSLHAPGLVIDATRHLDSREIPFYSTPGNHAADPSAAGFPLTSPVDLSNNWMFIEELQVLARPGFGTLVTVGDSITDGSDGGHETVSPNMQIEDLSLDQRYPDHLQRRLLEAGIPLTIANAGIGGNRLLSDHPMPQFGIALLKRFAEDVLARPALSHVLVMIGTNDFGTLPGEQRPQPDAVIEGYKQLIGQARAAGVQILFGTIPPAAGTLRFGLLPEQAGPMHGQPDARRARETVNAWIRSSDLHDGYVDFERCLEDPEKPGYLHPDYDSGDGLHPSPAGYEAMAACVDLRLLRGRPAPVAGQAPPTGLR